jgi:hypothetical protein
VISDVRDLVNTTDRYPAATPVLMAWLTRVDELPPDDARERSREGLIRSLSTRDARPVAGPLMVQQFRTVSLEPVWWAAGNAIGIVADSTVCSSTMTSYSTRFPRSARLGPPQPAQHWSTS